MAELKRTLSYPVILLITINSIMGTGIFFLPAIGAATAGPASLISWLVMAILGMGIALIFAELISMFPRSGGVYEYTKQAFGPFTSFLIGWLTIIIGNVTIGMLVVGAVQYLSPAMAQLPTIAVCIGFILAFNYMAYRGMQTSAVMLVAFGIVTLSTIFLLMIPGLLEFNSGNFDPFFTTSMPFVFLAVFLIAETFFGWETTTFLAEETKNPTKVMPRALWLGTLIIGIICLFFVFSSLNTIAHAEFGLSQTPLTDLALVHYGDTAGTIFTLLVYLSIIGSVAGWIVSAPRLLMSLAQDKLFIPHLADIHEEYNTPHKSILFQTILTSIIVIIGAANYETLLHLLVPFVLILYSMVVLTFIVLRYKQKETKRPFKVWAGVPLGVFLILCLLSLVIGWLIIDPEATQLLGLAAGFVILGIPVFFLLTFYYNPSAIIAFTEQTARFSLWLERLILPHRIRKEILMTLPKLEGKRVLDYGAGVGTMTKHLIQQVGAQGHITATDMSKKSLAILEKRLRKKKHGNFTIIHDPRQVNRIHPHVPRIDIVVSVGMLSYVQDFKKVLEEVNRLLPEDGDVCFVEYIDFFWLLPNAGWLKDEQKLLELFQETGFRVELVKIKGLFWKYLVIYGKKTRHSKHPYI